MSEGYPCSSPLVDPETVRPNLQESHRGIAMEPGVVTWLVNTEEGWGHMGQIWSLLAHA